MSKLSIVIPVFNKWNFTKSCLQDLSRLPADTHEIIIVDNGSTDQTSEELKKIEMDNLYFVKNVDNLGFAKACNRGYNIATAANVLFLNNDIRVKTNHSDWTQLIIDELLDNVIVGPTGGLVDRKNNFQFLYETNDKTKNVNYMSGWCLAATKNTFNKLIINNYIGPFSEEFGKAYFEDTDLGFRATDLGIKYKFVDIPVVHFGKVSSSQINTNKLYSEARKIFIKKWSR